MNAPFDVAAAQLTADTLTSLRTAFSAYAHNPSPDQWDALEAVVSTLARMATGTCRAAPHLSALDPGVGKTQAVIHFLRTLMASDDHRHVGVLVCVQRLQQIRTIIDDAGLRPTDFGVLTSDTQTNALGLGCPDSNKARILFTTHAMVERRVAQSQSFAEVKALRFRGQPRAVRVWDEALLPGEPLTVSRRSLGLLLTPLERIYPALVADLEEFQERLRAEPDGRRFEIPDFGAKHGIGIDQVRLVLSGNGKAEDVAEALWHLFGQVVTVRQDAGSEIDNLGQRRRGNTILDYRDTLPADLWPILILDASGRVRTLYHYWDTRRTGLIRLPVGVKSYANHTCHVWKMAGSKSAWRDRDRADRLAKGIAVTIRERLDEEWLVIVHKARTIGGFDVPEEVLKLLPHDARVQFTTWGKHDATNEFANIPNVVLAGTWFFPPSLLEAQGRCAAAFPSQDGDFAKTDIAEVAIGEHHHRILQALCRGRVRKCDGAACPTDTHTYIIAHGSSGIPQTIGSILPDAVVKEWRPRISAALKGRAAEALEAICRHPDGRIAASEVMNAIGWPTGKEGSKDFKSRIRDRPGFQDALAEAGFEEVRQGRGGQVWFIRSPVDERMDTAAGQV